ncbi:hypothetical protein B0H11DRAFT_2231694 [Mycena galericulata]|nr:hypothetical protein B0H11DRAFT_2231694 [Mycena galericulata]
MKSSTSLVALLSLVSVAVSSTIPAEGGSSCKASDRVLVDTHTVTAAGYEFQVSTKACSDDVVTPRALEKRVTFNVSISTSTLALPVVPCDGGPLAADCTALSNAITAAYEASGDATLFVVDPQFAQEFSLGTCLWAWVNNNPVNGAVLEYCYSGLTEVLGFNIYESCIRNGDTGGYVIPSNPQLVPASVDWYFEVLHS